MKLEIERTIPNLRPHTIIDSSIISSSGYKIYKSEDEGNSWDKCAKLPVNSFNYILSRFRLTSRLTRAGISQIKRFGDKLLISCDKRMFVSDLSFSYIDTIDLTVRAYQLLDNSICTTPGYVYYGEYFPNPKREEVRIYRSKDGVDWEVVYAFPERSIKHVHVLQYDPFTNKIWFSTGDSDKECVLGYADQDFSQVKIVGKESQLWRTLEFYFTKDYVYWATDTPLEQNKLVSYHRENGEVRDIVGVNGPVYNLKTFGGGYIMATAVEGGKGEWDNKARLWCSPDLFNWEECISYEKDGYPYLMGLGRLLLCDNLKDKIIFSGLGLKGIDNKLVIGRII